MTCIFLGMYASFFCLRQKIFTRLFGSQVLLGTLGDVFLDEPSNFYLLTHTNFYWVKEIARL